MADETEIGGVIIPSASSVPAPTIQGRYSHRLYLRTNAYREKIPPSPRLSAWSVKSTYLKVVCSVSVQNTQESPPYTNSSVIIRFPTIELNTYRGEVPM